MEEYLSNFSRNLSEKLEQTALWEKVSDFKKTIKKQQNFTDYTGKKHLEYFDNYKIMKEEVNDAFADFIDYLENIKKQYQNEMNAIPTTQEMDKFKFEIETTNIIRKQKESLAELNTICQNYENMIFENNILYIENGFDKKTEELTAAQKKLTKAIGVLKSSDDTLGIAIKNFENAKKDLKDEEHKILTHVLTLLGVFTAIITIILSSVSATTSWLNKSDSADFSSAILVPATIIVISMVAMFALLYLMIFKKYDDKLEAAQKDYKCFWSVILLTLICLVLLTFTIINAII